MSKKESFKESYGVLQRHAETLRNQSEPNIDDLLSIVEESVAAYKVCQTRIDAVEKALEQALNSAQPRAAKDGASKSETSQANGTSGQEGDEDIPF